MRWLVARRKSLVVGWREIRRHTWSEAGGKAEIAAVLSKWLIHGFRRTEERASNGMEQFIGHSDGQGLQHHGVVPTSLHSESGSF